MPEARPNDITIATWEAMSPKERCIVYCAKWPFEFACRALKTFDETDGLWKPYPRYDYLAKVFALIKEPKNRYWLKSQRMLITISLCVDYLWEWLGPEGFMGFWTGKHERSVDDGGAASTWKSALGKIRLMYDSIPPFLIEHQLGRHYHSSEIFKYLTIVNPKNNNIIIGQAPTPGAGVGEGYTKAVVDEAANVAYLETIHTNLAQACKHNRHYISFPLGRNNFFAKMHFQQNHFAFEETRIHWSENPNYTPAWYEEQKTLLTGFQRAQRLDMSFEESAEGKVFDDFEYTRNVRSEGVPYLPELPIWTIWDYGYKNATDCGFVQFDTINGILRIFDWFENTFTKLVDNAKDCRAIWVSYGKDDGEVIPGYGDPAANAVEQSDGITLQAKYQEQKILIEGCRHHETSVVLDTINDWLLKGKIIIDPKCEPIIEAMRYWEWPKNAKGEAKPGATQPAHDPNSHAGKALEYGFTMICMTGQHKISDFYGRDDRDEKKHITAGVMTEEF